MKCQDPRRLVRNTFPGSALALSPQRIPLIDATWATQIQALVDFTVTVTVTIMDYTCNFVEMCVHPRLSVLLPFP